MGLISLLDQVNNVLVFRCRGEVCERIWVGHSFSSPYIPPCLTLEANLKLILILVVLFACACAVSWVSYSIREVSI